MVWAGLYLKAFMSVPECHLLAHEEGTWRREGQSQTERRVFAMTQRLHPVEHPSSLAAVSSETATDQSSPTVGLTTRVPSPQLVLGYQLRWWHSMGLLPLAQVCQQTAGDFFSRSIQRIAIEHQGLKIWQLPDIFMQGGQAIAR